MSYIKTISLTIALLAFIFNNESYGQFNKLKDIKSTVKSTSNRVGSTKELKDNEKGNFIFNVNEFSLNGELTATLELAQPFKYYVMKWCKKSSCDYDHDNLNFAVFINDELLTAWFVDIWDDDYMVRKSFPIVVLPANDSELGKSNASFNGSKLYKDDNPLVYAMYDFLYSGRLKAGNHILKIKVYTNEVVPLNESYDNTAEYHSKWVPIAENAINLNITEENYNNFIAASNAKKLSHAGGDWDEIDNHLKTSAASGLEKIEIIDVATQSEWNVKVNSLGVPVYRDCKANIVYNSSEYGCRLIQLVKVRQDYIGNNAYGKPYVNENLNSYYFTGSTMVNHIHVPLPLSKVK